MNYENKTYYKLCRIDHYDDTNNYSFGISNLDFMLKYKIGEVTTAVEGSLGIFVFRAKARARQYANGCEIKDLTLFSCLVKGPVIPMKRMLDPFRMSCDLLLGERHTRKDWQETLGGAGSIRWDAWPVSDGIFSVKALKPFEELSF